MSDFFISHDEEDAVIALEIALGLERAGYTTWCYEIDNVPGQSYLAQIGQAIQESRAVVLLISPQSLRSRQITEEVMLAHESGKHFILLSKDVSHTEFWAHQPGWQEAVGSATLIRITEKGPAGILSRIIEGLEALGISSNTQPNHARVGRIRAALGELQPHPTADASTETREQRKGERRDLKWPILVSEAEGHIEWLRRVVNEHGKHEDRHRFYELETKINAAVSHHEADLLSEVVRESGSLGLEILAGVPGFWVSLLGQLEEQSLPGRDRVLAERLIADAHRAIATNDLDKLKVAVSHLISLMPKLGTDEKTDAARVKQAQEHLDAGIVAGGRDSGAGAPLTGTWKQTDEDKADEVGLINSVAEERSGIVEMVNSIQPDVMNGNIDSIEKVDHANASMRALRQRISKIRSGIMSSEGKAALDKLSEAIGRDSQQMDLIRENIKTSVVNKHIQSFNQIVEFLKKGRVTNAEFTDLPSRLESLRERVERDRDQLGRGEATQPLNELIREIDKLLGGFGGGVRRISGETPVDSEHRQQLLGRDKETVAGSRGGSPVVPSGRVDLVHFSVTSPPTVQPDSSFLVGIWAHLEKQRQIVIHRAREAVAHGEVSIASQGPMKVAPGTVLTVRLKLEDFIVEPEEAIILWEGEIGNATFGVRVPKDAKRGRRVGIATIQKEGFQIARIFFELHVGRKSAGVEQAKAKVQRHRTAFASYASADRDEVMLVVMGLQKGLPSLDIFVDVDSLRSGGKWQQELRKAIASRDVFYLFWSGNARSSQWVEKEWRCALEKRGLEFIDPCPLVSPKEVPPPPELESLHFYERWLAYRESEVSKPN